MFPCLSSSLIFTDSFPLPVLPTPSSGPGEHAHTKGTGRSSRKSHHTPANKKLGAPQDGGFSYPETRSVPRDSLRIGAETLGSGHWPSRRSRAELSRLPRSSLRDAHPAAARPAPAAWGGAGNTEQESRAALQPPNQVAGLLLLSGDSEDGSEQCNLSFLPRKGPTGTSSLMCKLHFFSLRNLRLQHSPCFKINSIQPDLNG